MAHATFVKKAQKDYPEHNIKKGESYWWWKFKRGTKQYSKERPRRSQLTQSPYLSSIYDIEDEIANFTADSQDEIEAFVSDIVSRLEELRDECQEKLDNMPDGLRESSSSGELLQERIDTLEGAISELESIDMDVDEEDAKATAEKDGSDVEEVLRDILDGISGEIQCVSLS